ncbi:DUF5103 domain-containing protein [Pedobacter sp.]|uniref:type IX secretion system plug protein n=1 Tax=Pedobacter sp. TaxID=1411316 RepID=UPI003D7F6E3A
MPIQWRLLILLVFCMPPAFAQQSPLVNDNQVFQPYIKTIQAYNTQKEQSLPVITLQSTEQLLFTFDDLEGGSKSYAYVVEHCTADWKPSGLSTLDYVTSFAGDRLQDYEYASGTRQNYTHYRLTLPNEQVQFKISGNYILKVYVEGRQKLPVISQRFYVVENLAALQVDVIPAPDVSQRATHQKLNFSVNTSRLRVQNPYTDIKTVVMQNGNPNFANYNSKASFVKPNLIQYNDIKTNVFAGGNEFRKLDLRNLRAPESKIRDMTRNDQKYASQFDENGNFFIRNMENRPPDTESDYIKVDLLLQTPVNLQNGEVYITGRFNNYLTNEQSKLQYNQALNGYQSSLYLKQGLYDYLYVYRNKENGALSHQLLEGNYYETQNAYQVFVYYRKPGGRWDELVGYLSTQTDTLPPKQ